MLRRSRLLEEARADLESIHIERATRAQEAVNNNNLMTEHAAVLATQKRCREQHNHGADTGGGWWLPSGNRSMACRMCGFVSSTRRYPGLSEEIPEATPRVSSRTLTSQLSRRAKKKEKEEVSSPDDDDDDDWEESEEDEEGEEEGSDASPKKVRGGACATRGNPTKD